jgi:hypothetical protein
LALWIAAGTVLLTDVNRFLPPVAERYVSPIGVGGSDLIPSFNAAIALLEGQNPYHSDLKKLPDPYAASRGEAENVTYLYPPSHALLYVPVAFLSRDFLRAARFQFFLSLLALVALSLAILDLFVAIVPSSSDARHALLPLLLYVLGMNPGSLLGLERGQSDLLTAALCWWGVAAFRRRWFCCAGFLLVASSALKGYGVTVAAGLLLLGLRRDTWRATLLGALLGVLVLVAPVARYLPDAIAAFPIRAEMFWSGWTNQSFYNLVYSFDPSRAETGRYVLVGLASSIALLGWFRLRRTLRLELAEEEQALALTLFATAALIALLGMSLNSIAYNGVLVLPGALLLVLTQQRLGERASPLARSAMGALLALTIFGMCAFSASRVFGRGYAREMPTHAAAMVLLVLLIGALSLRRVARGR